MKPDQEKVKILLIDTVALLCKNGLSFKEELKIQGLLGITVDKEDVFIVHIDEVFSDSIIPTRRSASDGKEDSSVTGRMVPAPVAEYNRSMSVMPRPNVLSLRSAPKSSRKRLSAKKLVSTPVKREKEDDWRNDVAGEHNWANQEITDHVNESSPVDDVSIVDPKSESMILSGNSGTENTAWIESDLADDSGSSSCCQIDFVVPKVLTQEFDAEGYSESYNPSNQDESLNANINELSNVMTSPKLIGTRFKSEQRVTLKRENCSGISRTANHSVAKRRSVKEVPSHLDKSLSFVSSTEGGENWEEEDDVKGLYPVTTEVGWDNEDQADHKEDHHQWPLNWENNHGTNGRRTTGSGGGEEREKSFTCQYEDCDKAFYRKDHLVRHQRIKHGKPFGVDSQVVYYCHFADCGRMFYKNASLHRHMNDMHGFIRQD